MANGIPNLCMTEMDSCWNYTPVSLAISQAFQNSWPDSGKDYNVGFGKVLVVMMNGEFVAFILPLVGAFYGFAGF